MDLSYLTGSVSLGDYSMLNTSESLNEERESHLSWILMDNAPEKYYLSTRAAMGILTRASRRGSILPEILKKALESMVERDADYKACDTIQ